MSDDVLTPRGIYRDLVIRGDGRRQGWGWRANRVVHRGRALLCAFMLGDSLAEPGVRFMALGRGEAAWDANPPPPAPGTQSLADTAPVTVGVANLSPTYLDAAGEPSSTVSARLQVTVTLAPGDLPISGDETFPLREFGLFGRYDGEDYMIDYVRHPVVHLGTDDTLVRRLQLIF